MRHPLTLFPILFFFLFSFSATSQELLEKTITVDGLEREYLLYVPAAYDGSEDWPLVLNLHGYLWDGAAQVWISEMNPVADTAHFLVAYPTGQMIDLSEVEGVPAFIPTEGIGWNLGGNLTAYDDIAYLDQMLEEIISEYEVDENRIYSTGFSMGGITSYMLACALSNRIAAVAPVAASLLPEEGSLSFPCAPNVSVPVFQIHGTADIVDPYDMPWGTLGVQNSIDFWVDQNGCDSSPLITELEDMDITDESTITSIKYQDCDEDTEVWLYRVNDGGHWWPGGGALPSGPQWQALGPVNRDINASVEIWNFFNRHSLPQPQLLEKTVNVDGAEREYLLYVPAAYDGSEDWPLVISYHENSVGPDQYIPVLNTNALADTAHFLVAYPAALDGFILPISTNGPLWNDGTPVGNADADDVAFTEQLIEQVAAEYNIDPARVYTKGAGGGGAMAAYAACQLSDRIAAMANVGGFVTCQPTREVPGLFMYGTADPVIPESGIPGVLPPFVEGVKGWAVASACDTIPEETLLPNLDPADSSTVSLFTYSDCAANSEVLYYRIEGGGRNWPGGPPIPNGGPVNRDIDADVEIWNFFNRNTLTSTKAYLNPSEIDLRAYPNPASTQLAFEFELPEAAPVNITLYNPLGQHVQELADETLSAGRQRISWQRPASLPAGLYYYRLQIGERFVARPVVLR